MTKITKTNFRNVVRKEFYAFSDKVSKLMNDSKIYASTLSSSWADIHEEDFSRYGDEPENYLTDYLMSPDELTRLDYLKMFFDCDDEITLISQSEIDAFIRKWHKEYKRYCKNLLNCDKVVEHTVDLTEEIKSLKADNKRLCGELAKLRKSLRISVEP